MKASPEQYERIALWLDGDAVELSPTERALAEEVRRDEALLAGAMTDVPLPARAMARARKGLRSAVTPQLVARARFVALAAGGAAVAAAVLVTWALRVHNPPPGRSSELASVPVDIWVQSMARPPGGEAIAWVAAQADQMEAEFNAPRWAPTLDRQAEAIQQEITDILLYEPPVVADDEG